MRSNEPIGSYEPADFKEPVGTLGLMIPSDPKEPVMSKLDSNEPAESVGSTVTELEP